MPWACVAIEVAAGAESEDEGKGEGEGEDSSTGGSGSGSGGDGSASASAKLLLVLGSCSPLFRGSSLCWFRYCAPPSEGKDEERGTEKGAAAEEAVATASPRAEGADQELERGDSWWSS